MKQQNKLIGRPKVSIDIPAEMLGKWEILRKPTHAATLSEITGYSEQTIRNMFNNGTAPDSKVMNQVDKFYNRIASELIELNDYE